MSFGLLKHFKDSKKGQETLISLTFCENLILGHDLGAILKLVELKKTSSSLKLITSRPLSKQILIETFQQSVAPLRSAEVVSEIYKTHYEAKIQSQQKEAQFYKDGKFHEFQGRAKSMELLSGEDFFVQKGFKVDVESLFSPQDWNGLDEILKEHVEIRMIEGIEKTQSTDLVQPEEWLVEFKDFHKISCKNLYVSLAPKKFLGYLKKKEDLSPELIHFCSSVEEQGGISVSWALNKEFFQDEQTLFIPQSMTHEWGHFIVEFERFNHVENTQMCHALFLIHEDEPQPEDLASKIKLLKRVLDRVFPRFEEAILQEFIRFDDEMFIDKVKDNLIEQISFDYPTLKLMGQMSPMKPQFVDQKFLARTLLS
jgi:hypothetical protein